jgi:hypothetical protein
MRYVACVIALGLSTAACGSDELPITFTEGMACSVAADDGATGGLQVMFDACRPCSKLQDESCAVALVGNIITVTASATFEPVGEGVCPGMCVSVTTECDLPALDDGTYELQFGGKSVPFIVPVSDAQPCVGNHPALN